MGRPELSPVITGQMKKWGGEFDSEAGCSHNGVADKKDSKITDKTQTLNIMSKMDAPHPSTDTGTHVDKSFWAKGDPLMDTTGHGKLTKHLKD